MFEISKQIITITMNILGIIWYHILKIKWNKQNFDTNVVTFLPYTYELPYESDLIVKLQVQSKVPNKVLR